MAAADEYAAWIVKNSSKKGTTEFDVVAQAYELAKSENTPSANIERLPDVTINAQSPVEDELVSPDGGRTWVKKTAPVAMSPEEWDAKNTIDSIPDVQQVPPQQAPSLADQLVGVGEAAATMATGSTTGAVMGFGGLLKGLSEQLLAGKIGTQEAIRAIQDSAAQGAEKGTYMPRTELGQEYVQNVGDALGMLPPVLPSITAPNALMQATRQAIPAAEAGLSIGGNVAGQAAKSTARGVQSAITSPVATAKQVVGMARQSVSSANSPASAGAMATIAPIVESTLPIQSAAPSSTPSLNAIAAQFDSVTPTRVRTALARSDQPAVLRENSFKAAPADILADQSVRQRPTSTPLDSTAVSKRDKVLDIIGIPSDSRRLGARTGDKNQIQKEVMLSKLDEAKPMRDQLDLESQKLAEYATAIQRDTGGTIGATPLMRGEAISAPLEGYQNWYNQQISDLYKQANEAAAGLGGIRLSGLKSYLNEPANFKGDGRSVSRDMRNELKRLGVMNSKGELIDIDAATAERIRQEANRLFDPTKPQTKYAVGGVKNAIDDDVLSVLPADIYKDARKMRSQYAMVFEDPKGLAKILDIDGPNGINRAISLDVLPDKLVNYAAKDTAQFKHIIKTLEDLPTPELQALGQKALAEVRAHLVEKMIAKNVDPTEAALGGAVSWRGTDDTLSRQMLPYRGKIDKLLGNELADRMETLRIGARILRPFDPNPSGTATAALNLQSESSKKAITAAGGVVGSLFGGVTGGPMGAAGGAVAGASGAKKVINVRQKRAVDKAIEKSLKPQKKDK